MMYQDEWRPVVTWDRYWDMNSVAAVCVGLDCGSAVSVRNSEEASFRSVWKIQSNCLKSGSEGKNCVPYGVISDQSHEIICSDIRLVGEASRCAGRLEMLHQKEWRPVAAWFHNWDMNSVVAVCAGLDCGSAVSARTLYQASYRPAWGINSGCLKSGSSLNYCVPYEGDNYQSHEIICSDSVRLVQGTNRCSGRLEVKTNQSWSSVCEKDFDLQDAEVVCREIGCGPPSVHQGSLYGEAEAPVGSREFLCEGSESALLNCSSRKSSGRNSCSPGQAVGLTCSDNIRLVGEASRCAGRLELLHQKEWRPVAVWYSYWDMNSAAAVCAELDCGSAVSVRKSEEASWRPVWRIRSDCLQSGSALKNCLPDDGYNYQSHEIICLDSVRLVQGTNRCSGRLEVKTDQSWSSVCEKDFDLQDAEVVCREIGCGPPSDSVRLVQGTNRCSGRLDVKTDQSWSSVCEKDFDLHYAEVVCREIGYQDNIRAVNRKIPAGRQSASP
ncbi:scavenger receptor cysteine-rich type 1 protein M130-like [Xiphophorus maculatus]|uniref:scavenger receptor cysteine-rich type 1 protein M130-like n=1 Tax=Xiphophorus maculatus TaxID=8083 RepID=UPI000C6D9D95|nr:scavenger receptor cysteine-rich type 1 protein M130-like [Xiphophorus maculatus]